MPRGGQRMPDKDNMNAVVEDVEYIVRRLTPTECARLQGFPDWWCKINDLKKPYSESAEYKAYGNGLNLPCALYVMSGIVSAVENGL